MQELPQIRKLTRRLTRALWGGLTAAALLFAVSGAFGDRRKTDDPHQWDKKKLGPLVPHKSFPADCGLCHVAKHWDVLKKDFSFDHEKMTGYKLEGAHASAHCVRCHNDRGPVERYIVRGCGGCHVDPHSNSLGSECTRCHNQVTWMTSQPAIDHASGRFPLMGAHRSVACVQCHPGATTGNYRNTSPECVSCHRADYASAANHASRGYSLRCDSCHTTSSFAQVRFDHSQLPGGGAGACITCHQPDYQAAPNHVSMNFPTTCQSCHTTAAWRPASFDHNILPGGGSGQCYTCHQSNYQSAPNHVSMGFPTTCQNCHTTTAWKPATFQHSFPISGPHNVSCASCHTTGTSTYTCLVCHEHRQSAMDNKHQNVNGYSYASTACYACHPNGRH